jgi:hypothetical protein
MGVPMTHDQIQKTKKYSGRISNTEKSITPWSNLDNSLLFYNWIYFYLWFKDSRDPERIVKKSKTK